MASVTDWFLAVQERAIKEMWGGMPAVAEGSLTRPQRALLHSHFARDGPIRQVRVFVRYEQARSHNRDHKRTQTGSQEWRSDYWLRPPPTPNAVQRGDDPLAGLYSDLHQGCWTRRPKMDLQSLYRRPATVGLPTVPPSSLVSVVRERGLRHQPAQ